MELRCSPLVVVLVLVEDSEVPKNRRCLLRSTASLIKVLSAHLKPQNIRNVMFAFHVRRTDAESHTRPASRTFHHQTAIASTRISSLIAWQDQYRGLINHLIILHYFGGSLL